MSLNLRLFLVIFSILLILVILKCISNKKLPIAYSLVWIFAAVIILLVSFFPNFINIFTHLVGFETTSNFVIGIILVLLLGITLVLTMIIAEQKKRIKLLVQEVSLIKNKIENKKGK